ncbi:MAG: response regulator [Deltaproteobacteria bacterium]
MPTLPPIYFERLLEDSPDIIIAVDRQGEIIFYNEGARTTLGYSAAEVAGHGVGLVYASVEEARRVMEAMRDPANGGLGKVRNFQTRLKMRNGEELDVAISGALIFDGEGLELGSIGFAKDLREIHRQDQLATLEEIAVSVAHEVNNPLAAILNNLSMLEGDVQRLAGESDCAVEQERIDSITGSIGKIQTIVNRLSEMATERYYGTREYLPGTRMADLGPGLDDAPKRDQAAGNTKPSTPTLPLAGLKILVVDDDLAVCQSVSELLRAQDCIVQTAANGLQARDLVDQRTFDCVLSDVVMPGLDGYDLFVYIREHYPATPVVLMTAFFYDRDHIIKRAKLKGLEGVLYKKPVKPARLLEILRQQCHR